MIKHQITKTLITKENNNSSNCIVPNLIYGCQGNCKSYCVEEGSLISLKDEEIPVEQIQDGDLVKSYDSSLELVELKRAYNIFHRLHHSWIEIQVENTKVVVTPEHPFYIVGKGWVEAQYLTEDDEVLCDEDYIKV